MQVELKDVALLRGLDNRLQVAMSTILVHGGL